MWNKLLCVLLPLCLTPPLAAQDFWIPAAGPNGGDVNALAGNNTRIFAAVQDAGVFRSEDNGESWQAANSGLADREVRALLLKDAVLFAAGPRGIFRSTDNGASWAASNSGLTTVDILSLADAGPNTLLCGSNGGGVFRSTDGGFTWHARTNGISDPAISCLTRNPGGHYFAGTISAGLFRSLDGGENWSAVNNGLNTSWIVSIMADPLGTLYCGTAGGGVYRSTDNGNSWLAANNGQANSYVRGLLYSNLGYLFAGGDQGVYRSTNGGMSWQAANGGLNDRRVFALLQLPNGNVYTGVYEEGGVYRSTDGGATWLQRNQQMRGIAVRALAFDTANRLFAGSARRIYRSTDGGTSWLRIGGQVFAQVWSIYTSADALHIGTNLGHFRSTDNGNTWNASNLNTVAVYDISGSSDGWLFAASSDGVQRSTNGGLGWERVGFGGVIMYAIAADADDDLYACAFGQLGAFRSQDKGTSWVAVNNGLTNRDLRAVIATANGGLYIATDGGGVFESANKGASWSAVNLGLGDAAVFALAGNERSDVFAGTFNGGVYRLAHNAPNWQALNTGLGVRNVQSLAMNEVDMLFAGTIAGSVYRSVRSTNPPAVEAGADTQVCRGDSVQLAPTVAWGFPPYSYDWQPPVGLDNPAAAMPRAFPEETTRYVLTVTDRAGSSATDSLVVAVLEPPQADAGQDAAICIGDSVRLSASGGVSYRWTPAAGLSCSDCAAPLASPFESTVYTVSVTALNGCRATDNVLVTVHVRPVALAGEDVTLCAGESTRLNASGGQSYAWTPAAGLSCTDCPDPMAAPQESTLYTVTVRDANGCEDTDDILVDVRPPVPAEAGDNHDICRGTSTTLTASGGVHYAWHPAEGLSCTDCPRPEASPLETTLYTVQVSDAAGCSAVDSVLVRVHAQPELTLNGSTLDFGTLDFCEPFAQRQVDVRNSGAEPVTIQRIISDLADFTLAGSTVTLPKTLQPGETLQFGLRFAPGSTGEKKGNLRIHAAHCNYSLRLELYGRKDSAPFTHSPASVFFSKEFLCDETRTDTTITIRNSGAEMLIIRDVTLEQWNHFSMADLTLPDTLAQGESMDIRLSFYQKSSTPFQYDLIVDFAVAGCSNSLRIPLAGEGIELAVDAGADVAVCRGRGVQLRAVGNPGYRYSWKPTTGLSDPTIPNPFANPDFSTVYTVTIENELGCTSSDELRLTVLESEKPELLQNGNRLGTNTLAQSYRWQRNGTDIPGAESREYIVRETGRYRLIVGFAGGCTDTSAVLDVTTVDLHDFADSAPVLKIYPNPNAGLFRLQADFPFSGECRLEVRTVLGTVVYSARYPGAGLPETLDVRHLAAGLYVLRLHHAGGLLSAGLLIQ